MSAPHSFVCRLAQASAAIRARLVLLSLAGLVACGQDTVAGQPQLALDDLGGDSVLDGAADTAPADSGTPDGGVTDAGGKDSAGQSDEIATGTDAVLWVDGWDASVTDADVPDGPDVPTLPDTVTGTDGSTGPDGTTVPDAGGDSAGGCPGALGCSCTTTAECAAVGACAETAAGMACVPFCQSGQPCAAGSVCVTLPGDATWTSDDDVSACVPKFARLCDPCVSMAGCATVGVPAAACVSDPLAPGDAGWFCSVPCANDAACPQGYECVEAQTIEVDWANYCRPKAAAACACSDSASAKGLATTCDSAANLPDGTTITCVGYRTCEANGLSTCSAPVGGIEVCNGLDDDCDGEIDETGFCDDGLPCTTEVCVQGECVASPISGSCDDGNACTKGEVCTTIGCIGSSIFCTDGNPCTNDSCDKTKGCVFVANTDACDDGNSCTAGEVCKDGSCGSGTPTCACTTDSDCKKADDGNLCNGTYVCADLGPTKLCVLATQTIVKCDPTNDTACSINSCTPATGDCALTALDPGTPCDDGTACTTSDTCLAGSCTGSKLPCNDGDACSADSCDPVQGCVFAPGGTNCDDGFVCTADSCNPKTGACVHTNLGATCVTVGLPYTQLFACEDPSIQLWQLAPNASQGVVRWNVDATPAVPAPTSASCSLNLNNGKDLQCPDDQALLTESAETPIFDATAITAGLPLRLRLQTAGDWPGNVVASLQVRIDSGDYADVQVVSPTASWQAIDLKNTTWAGHKVQFRLRMTGTCSGLAGKIGWFVDDFSLVVDQCAQDAGGCGQFATCDLDLAGKVLCTPCASGYVASNNVCIDIDECLVPTTCIDTANCTNKPGTFQCSCKVGYSGNGDTCTDIDECATGADDCAPTAACFNQVGSFLCQCPKDETGDGKTCTKLGYGPGNPVVNCAAVLAKYGTAPDGNYYLDPDGSGPLGPTAYYCDMKNGGWILLNYDDFEASSASGWSAGAVTTCGNFGKLLGGYGQLGAGATTEKSVVAPQHTEAKISLNYLMIDSWDNERGYVYVNGAKVFDQQHDATFKYSGDGNKKCGQGNWLEGKWDVAWTGAHTAASVVLAVSSNLNNGPDDEAFGIDNVAIWVR